MAVLCQCTKDKGKSVPRCAFYRRRSPRKAGEGLLHGENSFICLRPHLNLQTSSCRTRTAVFIGKKICICGRLIFTADLNSLK